MVIAALPNRSRTVEKFYASARTYGEKSNSCGDHRLWEMIENLRRSATVTDATRLLLRIAYRSGQNSMRGNLTAMDKHFGTSDSICPRCSARYKRHRDGGACPGEPKNFITTPAQPVEAVGA